MKLQQVKPGTGVDRSRAVDLSICTLGATSASRFGLALGFPILEFVDVEGSESGGDLRVGRSGGLVVPW